MEHLEARAGFLQTAAAQGLAVDLIVQNLSHQFGKAYGKPVDVSTLDQADRSTEVLASLRLLAAKAARGERLTEKEFVEVGRVAGLISQGHRS